MGRLLCALFIAITIIFPRANSQEIFLSKKKIKVNISVQLVRTSSNELDFLYTISNDMSSKQTIDVIAIGNRGEVGGVERPSSWSDGSGYNTELTHIFWFPGAYKDEDGAQNPPLDSIDPGESLGGFNLTGHKGPPTIVEWKIQGWAPVPILDEERNIIISGGVEYNATDWGDTILNSGDSLPNANFAENAVKGKTLGPSKSPTDANFLCDTFIVDLICQVREAAALGWIKHDQRKDRDDGDDDDRGKKKGDEKGKKKGHDKGDDDEGDDGDDSEMNNMDKRLPGVAKSIIKKLTMVRRECLRGKFGTAREKLLALIKQVNAQRGKKLTEEAYTLIKFNAEFLLEKL